MTLQQVAFGQVPYPDDVIQDITWPSGSHPVSSTQRIVCPGSATHPALIYSTADAEFVSGTQIHLTDGFHASWFTGDGGFRARIDPGLGAPGDVVTIAPDPSTSMTDGIIHVPKWEKFEIGLQLPQTYKDAIDGFFAHFYSNGQTHDATPGNVDGEHDLNPYADDSLQLVMTLIDPSGTQRMKWGFYMKEAHWASASPLAKLAENTTDPLRPYAIRFRMAPDEEGLWRFTLSVKAPHTLTAADIPLPSLFYSGYSFICDAPLSDNQGYLHVNPNNDRTLKFDTGAPFFGLGTNLADVRRQYMPNAPGDAWISFYQRDLDVMEESMEQLHSVGGNFMRLFLMRNLFTPEWVNLGVYDAYRTPRVCSLSESINDPDCNTGWTTGYTGNCQYQCWAFDQMLEHARENDIYLQLCIDPNMPTIAYEKFLWGAHPYVVNFLDADRHSSPANPYDMKAYFYRNGDPQEQDNGVYYYWKRKYKYMMARWGYSVNLAIIEPFNEIDQMLSYCPSGGSDDLTAIDQVEDCDDLPDDGFPHDDICAENRVVWQRDADLPGVVSTWFSDIAQYVRGSVDRADPVHSPLGEDRPFLLSFAGGPSASETSYFLPFTNPDVDLIDVHKGLYDHEYELKLGFDDAQTFRNAYPATNGPKKPFHQGEFSYYESKTFNGENYDVGKIFDNYDVSFHNELWASTFYGNFAAGTTWNWERVFWWPDALPSAPDEDPIDNPFQQTFSHALGAINLLNVNEVLTPVTNQTVYHNFKPLADLLSDVDWQAYDFFNGDFDAHKVYDDGDRVECYYLMNADNTLAIGWVHNLNAYWENHYYVARAEQNFLGCTAPNTQSIALPGFQSGTDYRIRWFPTRMNTTVHPDDVVDEAGTGTVTLDLSTAALGGVANNYLDTLHADYAFIITPSPEHRSLSVLEEADTLDASWGFALYPNPAWGILNVLLPDETPKDITISDLSGRQVQEWDSVHGPLLCLSVGHLARGAYSMRVSDGVHTQVKQLILR